MNKEHLLLFEELKKEVNSNFNSERSFKTELKDWKGEQIVQFQEDLLKKTKGSISEKWFYTYCKKSPNKLPRIDTLNLLCNYCGYNNWDNYLSIKKIKKPKITLKIITILLPVVFLFISLFIILKKETYQCEICFVNDETNLPVTQVNIEILNKNENSIYLISDSLGCSKISSKKEQIKVVCSSSFFISDTINLNLENKKHIIKLKTDDYALMLDYYTNGNIENWQKRKKQLEKLIDDQAIIYQSFKNRIEIEMYTKEEFINKLLIPTSSLKNIKILKKEYKNKKIVTLKFTTK